MTPAELARIHAAAFRFPRPWSESEIADIMRQPGVILVAEPGGFAIARVVADEAEVLTIAVDPGMRKQGIGRRLMLALMAAARHHGALTLHLEVAATNDAALALYAACGFRKTGRRKGYYHQPDGARIDAIVLSGQSAP